MIWHLQDAQAVLELLMTLKRLCCHLWTENETKITELQLNMLVRMLKTPNFSTRMNALQVGGHANRLANVRSFAPSGLG